MAPSSDDVTPHHYKDASTPMRQQKFSSTYRLPIISTQMLETWVLLANNEEGRP